MAFKIYGCNHIGSKEGVFAGEPIVIQTVFKKQKNEAKPNENNPSKNANER